MKNLILGIPIFELFHVIYSGREHFDKIACFGQFTKTRVLGPHLSWSRSPFHSKLGPHFELFWVPVALGSSANDVHCTVCLSVYPPNTWGSDVNILKVWVWGDIGKKNIVEFGWCPFCLFGLIHIRDILFHPSAISILRRPPSANSDKFKFALRSCRAGCHLENALAFNYTG